MLQWWNREVCKRGCATCLMKLLTDIPNESRRIAPQCGVNGQDHDMLERIRFFTVASGSLHKSWLMHVGYADYHNAVMQPSQHTSLPHVFCIFCDFPISCIEHLHLGVNLRVLLAPRIRNFLVPASCCTFNDLTHILNLRNELVHQSSARLQSFQFIIDVGMILIQAKKCLLAIHQLGIDKSCPRLLWFWEVISQQHRDFLLWLQVRKQVAINRIRHTMDAPLNIPAACRVQQLLAVATARFRLHCLRLLIINTHPASSVAYLPETLQNLEREAFPLCFVHIDGRQFRQPLVQGHEKEETWKEMVT